MKHITHILKGIPEQALSGAITGVISNRMFQKRHFQHMKMIFDVIQSPKIVSWSINRLSLTFESVGITQRQKRMDLPT